MAITTRADIMKNYAAGKGVLIPAASTAGVAITATANANDGFLPLQFSTNSVGSALPGTPIGYQLPPSPSSQMYLNFFAGGSTVGNIRGVALARIYKFGTLVLTSTGDKFTHDAATFPVTRTRFGAASTAIPLIPIISLTAATATTAPHIILKTAAGGTGYVNQDGSNVVGSITLTYPAAATAIRTAHIPPLERGDSAVTDISAIQVTTAGSAGTADVWGAEILCPLGLHTSVIANYQDTTFSGLHMADLAPAVATSGTATSFLVTLHFGNTTDVWAQWIGGVLNA